LLQLYSKRRRMSTLDPKSITSREKWWPDELGHETFKSDRTIREFAEGGRGKGWRCSSKGPSGEGTSMQIDSEQDEC
jgi:hypothetical protein